MSTDINTVAGILEDIKTDFNANNAMMGLLQTAFIASFMVFAPLFGYLGDRYSRKAIMAAGVFLWSVFTLIGSFITGKEENRNLGWSNPDFWSFLACRAMVGIGEASYSTIAPTIISDMFVKNMRSKMLALFYFAIPVGSGLGYIVGSETAEAFGSWQWGLRATPIAGAAAVIAILVLMIDPPRGESEGHQDMVAQSYKVSARPPDIIDSTTETVALSRNAMRSISVSITIRRLLLHIFLMLNFRFKTQIANAFIRRTRIFYDWISDHFFHARASLSSFRPRWAHDH